jgi:hypothetical protein
MKTQWSNTNELLSAIDAVRALLYETFVTNHLIDFKWISSLSDFKFSKNDLEFYFMQLLKTIIKEALGADIEVKLLILFIGAYFIPVKKFMANNTLVRQIKQHASIRYQMPHAA